MLKTISHTYTKPHKHKPHNTFSRFKTQYFMQCTHLRLIRDERRAATASTKTVIFLQVFEWRRREFLLYSRNFLKERRVRRSSSNAFFQVTKSTFPSHFIYCFCVYSVSVSGVYVLWCVICLFVFVLCCVVQVCDSREERREQKEEVSGTNERRKIRKCAKAISPSSPDQNPDRKFSCPLTSRTHMYHISSHLSDCGVTTFLNKKKKTGIVYNNQFASVCALHTFFLTFLRTWKESKLKKVNA